ncbi:Hypothetical predicted protein [Olea europaea subsp. europaea]|uniref:Uncharacterized protein n=1 Tax=Olea europaea subsp. europaea TaxID=158383 RepID=A0A8S0PRN6_OLEEU|nr:Hypothetical predicted protein [Olea europaea subsp. europaea]
MRGILHILTSFLYTTQVEVLATHPSEAEMRTGYFAGLPIRKGDFKPIVISRLVPEVVKARVHNQKRKSNLLHQRVRKTAQYKDTRNYDENDVFIPVEMLAINDSANLNGNPEHIPEGDIAAKIVAFTTLNHDDIHFTEEDLL